MSVTPSTLIADFPEFSAVDTARIQGAIDGAELTTDRTLFTDPDTVVTLLACHMLAVSPMGQNARLLTDKGQSVYGTEYESMVRAAAGGPWATGQGL